MIELEWYIILLVTVTGVVTGFINTVAGGGSSITLPLLMFLGLPPHVANGTNRVAILLQSIAGAGTFRKNKVVTFSDTTGFIIPSSIGALAGAFLAVTINEHLLKGIIIGVMAAMLLLLIFKPEAWITQRSSTGIPKPGPVQWLWFLLIGFYAGFIQVGVGFLLIAGLVLGSKLDLVRANALKVFIVLVNTLLAILIFWANNQVDFRMGILLGAGSMAGAWLGAKFTIRGGAKWIRWFLIVTIFAMILKLSGLF